MDETTPHGRRKFRGKPPLPKCGARTKATNADGSRKLCPRPGAGSGGRCHMHGGKSPVGVASRTFKHGRRSKYLVDGALKRYQDAHGDRHLLRIRQDAALIETMLTALMARLPGTGVQSEALERRIVNLIDKRRLLIAEEARRQAALQQTITLAQFMATMRAVAEVIREFVTDDADRRAAQRMLQRLLLPNQAEEGALCGEELEGPG